MARVSTSGEMAGMTESNALFRQIVERSHDGVWITDSDAVTSFVNQRTADLLGYAIGDIVGRSIYEFVDQAGKKALDGCLGSNDTAPASVTFLRHDGTRMWGLVSTTPLETSDGSFAGMLNTVTDITTYHEAGAALEERETWLQIVVNSAPLVLWAADLDGTITLSEGRGLQGLGFKPGELVGRNVFELYPDDPEGHSMIRRALGGETFSSVTSRGELWFETSYSPILNGAGEVTGTIAVSHDITERKRAQERVDFLAYHDELTGLPNRSLFQDHMTLALARARRRQQAVALLYLDFDRFKLVNDSFGHAAGDELLRRLGRRLRSVVREEDLVARHSGDEFLVLLADLPTRNESEGESGERIGAVKAAELVAEKIHDVLREVVEIDGHEISIDASIGISLFPRDASDSETLLQHADIAMYESKRFGRGRTEVFGRSSHDPATRLSVAGRLRGALEREQFVLYYQPIVELATNRMRGVEALLRWADPDGDLMYPGEFIPVAEEIGILTDIDDWVISEAARQWSEWHRQGLDLQVSVNLSSIQFRVPDLADKLLSKITGAGADPSGMILEITESAVMADADTTNHILSQLRAARFVSAIDDFGAGYSSLSRLADLPVNMLKMDGSFVRNIPNDDAASVMVSGLVKIARDMGVYSLAEGIERTAQRDFLAACGCDLGQGFAFSEALPPEQIPGLVLHR